MFNAFHLPINSVSFGQLATGFLRKLYAEGATPSIFPIGNPDLSTQKGDSDFDKWLNDGIGKSQKIHSRGTPVFRLWHIAGSLESFSDEQHLFTFYELDQPTPTELNILRQQKQVFVSSEYTKEVLETFGIQNVVKIPLYFDERNFHKTEKEYSKDRITFTIGGKFEKRKRHVKAIRAWLNKFGNNKDYVLQCAIQNPFLSEKDNTSLVNQITQGKNFFNLQFFGKMDTNVLYNDFLNSGDIVLGVSGAEGWGLPEFQSVGLGKHAVILNAHAYKEWANEENAVMFNPNAKIEAYDDMFFHKGKPTNQGNIFDFDGDEFISACEKAIKRVETSRVNTAGLKLVNDFSIDKFYYNIQSNSPS
tara:strand:- start:480 stop:1562 length:1083 start_codon:yes stop_codon:yes gene_type:complete